MLNRNFSNSIFDVFFGLGIRGTVRVPVEAWDILIFLFSQDPMVSELQAKTWCDGLGADDDDDWLLGRAYQLEMQNFSKSQTRSHISIAQNPLGLAPCRMALNPGTSPGFSIWLSKKTHIKYIGIWARRRARGPKTRLSFYRGGVELSTPGFCNMSWDAIPDLVVTFESYCLSSR